MDPGHQALKAALEAIRDMASNTLNLLWAIFRFSATQRFARRIGRGRKNLADSFFQLSGSRKSVGIARLCTKN